MQKEIDNMVQIDYRQKRVVINKFQLLGGMEPFESYMIPKPKTSRQFDGQNMSEMSETQQISSTLSSSILFQDSCVLDFQNINNNNSIINNTQSNLMNKNLGVQNNKNILNNNVNVFHSTQNSNQNLVQKDTNNYQRSVSQNNNISINGSINKFLRHQSNVSFERIQHLIQSHSAKYNNGKNRKNTRFVYNQNQASLNQQDNSLNLHESKNYYYNDNNSVGDDESVCQLKENPQKEIQLKQLEKKLWKQNAIQKSYIFFKIFQLCVTISFGIFDEVLDLIYISQNNFQYDKILYACILSVVMSPLIQLVVWAYFLSMPKIDVQNFYQRKKLIKHYKVMDEYYKAIGYIVYNYLCFFFKCLFSVLKEIPMAMFYTLLSELKILPFYIAFTYQTEYLVSEDILQEFIYKKKIFLKNKKIQKLNEQIKQKNKEIREFNDLELVKEEQTRYEDLECNRYKADLKKEKPEIKQIPIPESTADIILLGGIQLTKNVILRKITEDAILKNIMLIQDIMESVFEALPMLVIQYINNSINEAEGKEGWSLISTMSFLSSLFMVIVFSFKLTKITFSAKLFPAIEFYNEIRNHRKTINNKNSQKDIVSSIEQGNTFNSLNNQDKQNDFKQKIINDNNKTVNDTKNQINTNTNNQRTIMETNDEDFTSIQQKLAKKKQSLVSQHFQTQQKKQTEFEKKNKLKCLNWITNQQSSIITVRTFNQLAQLCKNSDISLKGWKKIILDFENKPEDLILSKGKIIDLIQLLVLRVEHGTVMTINLKYNDCLLYSEKCKIYQVLQYSNVGGLKWSSTLKTEEEAKQMLDIFDNHLYKQRVFNLNFDNSLKLQNFQIPRIIKKHQKYLQELVIYQNLPINRQADEFQILLGLFDRKISPNLQKLALNLSNNKITLDEVKEISTKIANNTSINKLNLNLSMNEFGSEGGKYLAYAFKENKLIKNLTLDLSQNDLGYSGGVYFEKYLSENNIIQKLDLNLGKNNLTDKGGKHLGLGVYNNVSLTYLYLHLRENNLGKKTGQALGKAIEHNNTLKTLKMNLRWNNFESEGGKAIGNGLKKNISIDTLYINFWKGSGDYRNDCCKYMVQGLIQNTNPHLQDLTLLLRTNHLGDRNGEVFGELLKKNKTIQSLFLHLEHNLLSPDSIKSLIQGIKHNKHVDNLKLNLARNNLTREQCIDIVKAIKENNTIKHLCLNLQSNQINQSDLIDIQDILTSRKTLSTVFLEKISQMSDQDNLEYTKNVKNFSFLRKNSSFLYNQKRNFRTTSSQQF